MSEQHSRGISVVEPSDDSFEAFFELWFLPLWDFATLLLGSRAAGERAALDAMLDARAMWDRLGGAHQPLTYARERVVRTRPPRIVAFDPQHETILRALVAVDHADRAALIALVHERVPDAEAARIVGCEVAEVRARVDHALERTSRSLAAAPGFTESWLRVAMQRVAEDRPALTDPSDALTARAVERRRAGAARWTGIAGLIVFVAGIAAFAGIVAGGSTPARGVDDARPGVFVDERLGYELTITEGWRVQPMLADPRGRGTFDPSRFGLSTVEPSDETAAFIPDEATGASALLRITVSPTTSHLADVGRLRDALGERQRSQGAFVTAALVTIVDRPATRFRIEHPDDSIECAGCRSMVWSVLWFHGTTMTIEFSAFSQDAFDRLAPDAEEMIESLRPIDGDATLRYRPESGTVGGGIKADAALEAVLQFMDARLRGAEAEAWLSEDAAELYRFDGRLGLYAPSAGGAYLRYRVVARAEAPDGSPSFDVDIVVASRPGGEASGALRERLVVGPALSALGQSWPEAMLSAARADTA